MPTNVYVVFALCVACLCVSFSYAHEDPKSIATDNNLDAHGAQSACNSTADNSTKCGSEGLDAGDRTYFQRVKDFLLKYQGTIFRALVVFGSVASIIIIYVSIRCIRLVMTLLK
jgi:hypothetical protein